EVRYATGSESYLTFSDETENPQRGEVIFVDGLRRAHARRWTNRQSGLSAVRDETTSVVVVAEAMHSSAQADVQRLITTIADELKAIWSAALGSAILTRLSPRFEF